VQAGAHAAVLQVGRVFVSLPPCLSCLAHNTHPPTGCHCCQPWAHHPLCAHTHTHTHCCCCCFTPPQCEGPHRLQHDRHSRGAGAHQPRQDTAGAAPGWCKGRRQQPWQPPCCCCVATCLCVHTLHTPTHPHAHTHTGGAHERQHGRGPRVCGCSQGLPAHPHHAGHHVHRTARPPARARRTAGAHREQEGARVCGALWGLWGLRARGATHHVCA
jgi:hypothetical protein